MSSKLTHIDNEGNARMVDVTQKQETERIAIARGKVLMAAETLELVRQGQVKKGDVLQVAQLAGIMAAKRTPDLIPLCHPLMLSSVKVNLEIQASPPAILIEAMCKLSGKTGVEMEALTAVSVAALTIYDMLKAADKGMIIDQIHLIHKSGGKSGEFNAR